MRPLALPLLASLLLLAACAGDGDPTQYREVGHGGFGRGGGGDPATRRPGLPNTFISPEGKPYRAPPGQPYPVVTWFASADTDHDGKLTLTEFRKDAEAFFTELDANHDGIIDGFELQAYEQKVAPEILPRVEGLAAGEGMDLSLGRSQDRGGGQPVIGSNGAARRAVNCKRRSRRAMCAAGRAGHNFLLTPRRHRPP